jgi:hypothetical protein
LEAIFMLFKNDQFTNTGSGQIQEKLRKEAFFLQVRSRLMMETRFVVGWRCSPTRTSRRHHFQRVATMGQRIRAYSQPML